MLASRDDMTPEEQSAAELVQKRFGAAKRLHIELEARWIQFYGLSRNYHRLGGALTTAANPRDKDIVISEIKREFGQELFIPYAFTVIETNVPRILSRSPRYRALPTRLDEAAEAAKRPMERLYERDSENMRYERKLQETVRSGLRYGLGVQKEYWKETYKATKRVKPGILGTPLGRQVLDDRECVFKGPEVESVDIFDFFWDPTARDLATAQYVIHRTWRSHEYVEDRVRTGKWAELDLERIQGLKTQKGRGSAWDGRYQASGLSGYSTEAEEYEVLEYHDRDQVITVLGGELVVQMAPNPYLHGEFPFEIYRPTLVEHEFCGIGEVEPIAHLQWELNELRGQRRDAATLALNRGYFYMAGSLDPALIKTGVGVFNPVYQPPSEVIMPMPFTDVPQSGWEEERSIKSDIELTTAMSEAVIGSGGEDTATGTQMVQQAASFRIRQKAKNLSIDLLRPETRKRKALYEQHYVGSDEAIPLRVEDPLTPTGFDFIAVTPEMFGVGLEVLPIDGSTEPDDPAQKKTDAGDLASALAPFAEVIDVERLVKYIVEQHDVENPGEWIKQGPSPEEAAAQFGEQVMQSIAWAMEDAGVDKDTIEQILETAHQALESEMPPGEEQGEGEPAPESVPASRNGAPEPIGTP